MKTRLLSRYALSSCVAAAMLAGCGGSQPPIGAPGALPQSRAITLHARRGAFYKTTHPLLYVANANRSEKYNDVAIYRANAKDPAPLATITGGINTAFGACIDSHGTLYVTNEPNTGLGYVSEYPLGKTRPSRVITDGVKEPGFCAIDADGNLWVANIYGPNITEYLYGVTKPHRVITTGLIYPIGIAIDHSGNLYVGNGFGGSEQNVEVYAPGSKSPSRTITSGITSPCGLTVDSNGTLYVANEFQSDIAEYRSGQSVPFQTITQGIAHVAGLTVDKKDTLYVANIGGSSVVEYPLGSLKPLKRQIIKGLYNPVGIAHYPALLP